WKTNGDRPLSEDILQESYVRFLLHLDKLESIEDLAVQSYLLQTVRNCLIDKVGRPAHKTRPHVELTEVQGIADAKETSRLEAAVELRELQLAMRSLNEKDSEIIWLRDGLGLSHREVAEEIGITEDATRQAYGRAKKNLMAVLCKGHPVALPAGGAYVPEMS
ncbi:MAG: sigma-70 family RNA polymerase sigma factor, partial [Proteobacteria bacterium]|nr:sigma-70 family RNA polymerase sigma factor [Pseudomonadota bacterium]